MTTESEALIVATDALREIVVQSECESRHFGNCVRCAINDTANNALDEVRRVMLLTPKESQP